MAKTIYIDIGIGIVTIHDNYLVTVMHEGITVSIEANKILTDLVEVYFKDKPFVYITHRKNSYAVDTSIYKETAKIPNLIGFSVVSKKGMALTNASIEKRFFSKPFEIFEELDEAIAWSKKMCENHLQNPNQ
jgi:hypothetical protein